MLLAANTCHKRDENDKTGQATCSMFLDEDEDEKEHMGEEKEKKGTNLCPQCHSF